MSKLNNLTDFLTGIADAIRAKKGTSAAINPQNFESEIASIPSGGGKLAQVIDRSVTTLTADDFGGATSIGSHVFYSCSSLTSITIPNSVINIDDYAFFDCSSLTSIEIPNSVTSIGNYTFYKCSSLANATIGNSVTSIGDYAFWSCNLLPNITIPNSVTSIGNSAFYSCSSLTSVIIGNSVKSIGNYTFYNCSSLPNIIISDSIKTIGNYAFWNCTSLMSITCKAINPPSIQSSTFNNVPSTCAIYVPASSVNAYKSATNWSSRASYIQAIPE